MVVKFVNIRSDKEQPDSFVYGDGESDIGVCEVSKEDRDDFVEDIEAEGDAGDNDDGEGK